MKNLIYSDSKTATVRTSGHKHETLSSIIKLLYLNYSKINPPFVPFDQSQGFPCYFFFHDTRRYLKIGAQITMSRDKNLET